MRLETRLIWRYGPGQDDFLFVTYWWNPASGLANDAKLADAAGVGSYPNPPDGVGINGTTHNIPSQADCQTCHGSLKEHVLGFGAIELNHNATLPGLNINTVIQAGMLTRNPNLADLTIPGDATAQAALGYLHANCSNCHNVTPGVGLADGLSPPYMNLRLYVGTKTVEETNAYKTAVNQPTTTLQEYMWRIAGGDPKNSAASNAMANRWNTTAQQAPNGIPDSRAQMPALATNFPDVMGIAQVNAWIQTLPRTP
jgi:hypothetical protein